MNKKRILYVMLTTIIVLIIAVVAVGYSNQKQKEYDHTVEKILKNRVEPISSETSSKMTDIDKSKPQMFIMYKKGCPVCEATFPKAYPFYYQLKENGNNVSYVEINSELGQYLKSNYPFKRYSTILAVKDGITKIYDVSKVKDGHGTGELNIEGVRKAINYAFK